MQDRPEWRKARKSGGNGGSCVEVADLGDSIGVRDSKDRTGPVLHVNRLSFAEFIAQVKAGRFDL